MSDKRIDCLKCKYYFTSWDPERPRGCRLYGFKSKDYPNLVVMRETGEDCLSFEEKFRPKLTPEKE